MTTWMYLTDMAPRAMIVNLDTGELRQIMSSAVEDRAPSGLRRYTLEELEGGVLRETGKQVPLSDRVFDDLNEFYRPPNSWNYDWPHLAVERQVEANDAMANHVFSRLHGMMSQHPYDFQITGMQRRYLMYFSDGDYRSQKRFERLIPAPAHASPFRLDGSLQRRYEIMYNNNMRDAKVPIPEDAKSYYGDLRPCLYLGAAWVVRFRVDGQDVLTDRCRVYVDDDANFICSDWCQRHDFTSYSNGINLQTGIYTFDTWVTGPCLIRGLENGGFQPRHVQVKRTTVRDLLKRAPAAVPDFDTALAKASAAVSKYSKPLAPKVEAGPITADVMAEAMVEWARILAEKAPSAPATPDPVRGAPTIHRVPSYESDVPGEVPVLVDTVGYAVSFERMTDVNGCVRVRAYKWYRGDDYRTALVDTSWPEEDSVTPSDVFIIDDSSPTGFWYSTHPDDVDVDADDYENEEIVLNTHWWLYSAATYYANNLVPSAVESTLLALGV